MASCTSCLLSRLSNCRSQHFCDVYKYMFRMDQSNGHNNQCSNCVFKVYVFYHHCSTVQEAMAIKWVYLCKWPTYYSSHYCIIGMKQYNCVAKIQITLYCNMAYQSLFARYVLYYHKYDNWSLMLFVSIWCFDNLIYEYISIIHKIIP